MKNLVEFRARASLCRQLAMREPASRVYWLAEAERWLRLEQEEISALFTACNVVRSPDEAVGPVSGSAAG